MQRYKLIQTQKNFYRVFFNKKSIISFNKNFLIQKPNNIYLFVKTCTINSSFSFVCNNRMFGETFLSYHNVSKKGLFILCQENYSPPQFSHLESYSLSVLLHPESYSLSALFHNQLGNYSLPEPVHLKSS